MDLTSRLRSIVRPLDGARGRPPKSAPRELTYEPDTGRYEGSIEIERVADVLGGRVVTNGFGRALIVDRRYESDRVHGTRRVWDGEFEDGDTLMLLDPTLAPRAAGEATRQDDDGPGSRTLFVDLETTGLRGGAGTVAYLVGSG